MRKNFLIQLVFFTALAGAGSAAVAVAADTDPTMQQIYEAARSGQLPAAQQMMNQVLRDHPQSAKAHYVQAELYAREGNLPAARQELSHAEQLAPGLPFVRPDAVHELQQQLSTAHIAGRVPAAHAFPWGIVLLVGSGIVLLLLFLRRRSTAAAYPGYAGYPQAGAQMPGPVPMPGPYGGAVMTPNAGFGGSGLASNLVTGLAVGAGLAAGEELVHRVFDSNHGGGVPMTGAGSAYDSPPIPENTDMGGNDFGISDAGSWDDGGGSFGGGDMGGGGGGDWT